MSALMDHAAALQSLQVRVQGYHAFSARGEHSMTSKAQHVHGCVIRLAHRISMQQASMPYPAV